MGGGRREESRHQAWKVQHPPCKRESSWCFLIGFIPQGLVRSWLVMPLLPSSPVAMFPCSIVHTWQAVARECKWPPERCTGLSCLPGWEQKPGCPSQPHSRFQVSSMPSATRFQPAAFDRGRLFCPGLQSLTVTERASCTGIASNCFSGSSI